MNYIASYFLPSNYKEEINNLVFSYKAHNLQPFSEDLNEINEQYNILLQGFGINLIEKPGFLEKIKNIFLGYAQKIVLKNLRTAHKLSVVDLQSKVLHSSILKTHLLATPLYGKDLPSFIGKKESSHPFSLTLAQELKEMFRKKFSAITSDLEICAREAQLDADGIIPHLHKDLQYREGPDLQYREGPDRKVRYAIHKATIKTPKETFAFSFDETLTKEKLKEYITLLSTKTPPTSLEGYKRILQKLLNQDALSKPVTLLKDAITHTFLLQEKKLHPQALDLFGEDIFKLYGKQVSSFQLQESSVQVDIEKNHTYVAYFLEGNMQQDEANIGTLNWNYTYVIDHKTNTISALKVSFPVVLF